MDAQIRRHRPSIAVCIACRAIHKRCDGDRPCRNCVRRRVSCSLFLLVARNDATQRTVSPVSYNGGEAFNYFANFVATRLLAAPYWVEIVVPISQSNDAVLNAARSYGALRTSPLDKNVSLAIPNGPLQWYSESLRSPELRLNPEVDPSVILITANLFANIEHRLGNFDSVDTILRSAVAIIYNARREIRDKHMRNSVIFHTIKALLMSIMICTACGPVIPRHHWTAVIIIALEMSSYFGDQDTTGSMIELMNIDYDLRMNPRDSTIGNRVESLRRRVNNQEEAFADLSKDRTDVSRQAAGGGAELLIQWYFRRWKEDGRALDRELFNIHVSHHLKRLEDAVKNVQYNNNLLSSWIDGFVLRAGILIVWHLREDAIYHRVKNVLVSFKSYMDPGWMQRILEYLRKLIRTPHGQPTDVDYEVFGANPPTILADWQLWRICYHLAREPGRERNTRPAPETQIAGESLLESREEDPIGTAASEKFDEKDLPAS